MIVDLSKYDYIKEVSISEMKDGDIAIITYKLFRGRLVQRYGGNLISIGMHQGNSWANIFPTGNDLTVKIIREVEK